MRIRFVLLTLVVALVIQGCATVRHTGATVVATVESQALPTAAVGKTYVLLSGNKGTAGDDARFREYADCLQRALAVHGFIPASTRSEADVTIVLSYGVVDPHSHQDGNSVPAWIRSGATSDNTYGAVTPHDNTASQPGATARTSSYGIAGHASGNEPGKMYFRYAKVVAYAMGKRQNEEIWKTTAVSMGSNGDLEQIFPFLVAAAKPYFASNTDRPHVEVIHESDLDEP